MKWSRNISILTLLLNVSGTRVCHLGIASKVTELIKLDPNNIGNFLFGRQLFHTVSHCSSKAERIEF